MLYTCDLDKTIGFSDGWNANENIYNKIIKLIGYETIYYVILNKNLTNQMEMRMIA